MKSHIPVCGCARAHKNGLRRGAHAHLTRNFTHPKNTIGGKPLLVGLPPSVPTSTPFGTKTQNARPLLVGRAFVTYPRQLRPPALSAMRARAVCMFSTEAA